MSNNVEYKMPTDPTELKAFERIDSYVTPNDMKETQRFYDDWADKYDDDLDVVEFKGISQATSTLLRFISLEERTRSDFSILDLASGTGRCGKALRDSGFKCIIDALEANEAMNQKASKKGIYRNLTVHVVTPTTKLPIEDESYDVIVCTGGFSRTHIQSECIKDVVRVLKPGGLFWFCVRNTKQAENFNKEVEDVLSQLTGSGEAEIIIRQEFGYYVYKAEVKDSSETVSIPGLERCIRKLK
uniref:Methyltransferase-like protein 27 n=1 Tax=Ciona intestinalis TaxID=7719 RepID=H2XWY6_CIOIN|nr:methyltransferase-like protein 27 [Ciona intestinalis]|eukprot:XP_026693700.1 methyltransferase-like protein 27 [Ciona intestinalis]